MKLLKFTVPGRVMPLGRGRKGQHGQIYTTREDLAYQHLIWLCAMKAGARQGCFGDRPLALKMAVFVQQPKRKPKYLVPTTRPDTSNYVKQVEDALRHAFKDDAQIVVIHAVKLYGEPHLEVHLYELDEIPGETQ